MSNTSREQILEAALRLVRAVDGGSITLASAAQEAGLSKPGLMYHFPTKTALMNGVVDHVAARWEQAMIAALDRPREQASPSERIGAYVRVALSGSLDRADFAIFTDAVYSPALKDTWIKRLSPWFALPEDMPLAERGRLTAARLMADGYWTALAADTFVPRDGEREQLLALAEQLLKEGPR